MNDIRVKLFLAKELTVCQCFGGPLIQIESHVTLLHRVVYFVKGFCQCTVVIEGTNDLQNINNHANTALGP